LHNIKTTSFRDTLRNNLSRRGDRKQERGQEAVEDTEKAVEAIEGHGGDREP
jgi:hypothetical protein